MTLEVNPFRCTVQSYGRERAMGEKANASRILGHLAALLPRSNRTGCCGARIRYLSITRSQQRTETSQTEVLDLCLFRSYARRKVSGIAKENVAVANPRGIDLFPQDLRILEYRRRDFV
jgi:hypothetical protein